MNFRIYTFLVLWYNLKLLHLYRILEGAMETNDLSVIKNRIDMIRQKKGMNLADFAEAIGVGRATITHISQGRNNPSLDVIMKIINRFPDISIQWLLNGRGEMEDEQPFQAVHSPSSLPSENEIFPDPAGEFPENSKEMALRSRQNMPEMPVREVVKYVEKPPRRVTEIRIFFDDNTYEIFKPEN